MHSAISERNWLELITAAANTMLGDGHTQKKALAAE